MKKNEWHEKAANFLKGELAKKGIDYNELVFRLKDIGIEETYISIANKINRGSYSFGFFMQCMEALKIKEIRL